MTIRDKATEFSTKQDVGNGGAGTKISTNVIDTQIPGGDAAVGEETRVSFLVEDAFSGGTSCQFQLFTDDDTGFGSEVKLWESPAIAVANLGKGAEIKAKLPFGCKRYLRAKYVVVGATTVGVVTGGIVHEVDNWKAANPIAPQF